VVDSAAGGVDHGVAVQEFVERVEVTCVARGQPSEHNCVSWIGHVRTQDNECTQAETAFITHMRCG
jgi:hypothetical protein